MNFFNNDVKYVDLELNCLGDISLYGEEFENFIMSFTEIGCTYRFVVTHNGNTLTKDSVPFDSRLFTIRDNEFLLENGENLFPNDDENIDAFIEEISFIFRSEGRKKSEDEIEDFKEEVLIGLADSSMLFEVRTSIEGMIQESDYYKKLYLDKRLINEGIRKDYGKLCQDDTTTPKLSLAYFKCSV
jgi:hypothetical protein